MAIETSTFVSHIYQCRVLTRQAYQLLTTEANITSSSLTSFKQCTVFTSYNTCNLVS
jgi:hypothetical protein